MPISSVKSSRVFDLFLLICYNRANLYTVNYNFWRKLYQ